MKMSDLNISIEGEGQPMLLLHGWNQSNKCMELIFDYFKSNYRVCMLDLPGFGNSAPLSVAYSIYDYVDVIKQLIKYFGLDNPIIIAHSFGARIAFFYAAIFPVKYLIVSGAAGIKQPRNINYYIKVYTFKLLKKFNIPINMGSNDYKSANGVMKETLVKIVNSDASESIKEIQCPILLVWGENDEETPIWMAHQIKKINKNAYLIVFEKDDHFAFYHQINRFIKVCEYALKGGNE